jgi:hypothetical protein
MSLAASISGLRFRCAYQHTSDVDGVRPCKNYAAVELPPIGHLCTGHLAVESILRWRRTRSGINGRIVDNGVGFIVTALAFVTVSIIIAVQAVPTGPRFWGLFWLGLAVTQFTVGIVHVSESAGTGLLYQVSLLVAAMILGAFTWLFTQQGHSVSSVNPYLVTALGLSSSISCGSRFFRLVAARQHWITLFVLFSIAAAFAELTSLVALTAVGIDYGMDHGFWGSVLIGVAVFNAAGTISIVLGQFLVTLIRPFRI